MSDHQLDSLARRAASTLDRRGSLKAFGTAGLIAGLGLAEAPWPITAKGKKGKGKGKGKGKRKPKPSCSGGACADAWAGNQAEIDYCEFICRQCDGADDRDFCIVAGDPTDPAKVAVCCDEAAPCCGDDCCPVVEFPHLQCCVGRCTDTSNNPKHCGACGNRCAPGEVCRDGDCQCGFGAPCTSSETCCGDSCIDLMNDRNSCGSCGVPCPLYHFCVEGNCRPCPRGQKRCNNTLPGRGYWCIPEDHTCCQTARGSWGCPPPPMSAGCCEEGPFSCAHPTWGCELPSGD